MLPSLTTLLLATLGAVKATKTPDLSDLGNFLKSASALSFPALKKISIDIYNSPELGLNETHAHDWIVSHFSETPGWKVIPHSYNLPTAFTAIYEHRPAGFNGKLPAIGFLAEYDALIGIGHACGHNHIALNGITGASLTAQALAYYDIPGIVILQGTPDEENAAGKFKLNNANAFDAADIWLMAHPTTTSAINPMNARLNFFATFSGQSHQEAVFKAYKALVIVKGLRGRLPGTSSSATGIENVGQYATNVVQSFISLGVTGPSLDAVNKTLASILDTTYPGVAYTVFNDANGVALNITGPGGHSSETTKGALDLSIAAFQALNSPASQWYLPGNTSINELDITINMRTRYSIDMPIVANYVANALGGLPSGISHDVKYPALEVDPWWANQFINIANSPNYGLNFVNSTVAPASSDGSWIQDPVLDPVTHSLISVAKVVLHANYNICAPGGPCVFNHEPLFQRIAGTEFSYTQTEIVARAESQLAIELLSDPAKYAQATTLIRRS